MKSKSQYKVLIGKKVHLLEVDSEIIDGQEFLEEESLSCHQKRLAIDLLIEAKMFDGDLFNFSMNVVGEKSATIAKKIPITPAYISKVRSKESVMSAPLWKLFRLVMVTILSQKLGLKENFRLEDIILSDIAS